MDAISDSFFADDGVVLAEWPSDSAPSRDDCVATIDKDGTERPDGTACLTGEVVISNLRRFARDAREPPEHVRGLT